MSLLDRIGRGMTAFGENPVGKGLVSFASGVPSSGIDTIRANRDIAEADARIATAEADAIEGEPARLERMQRLIEGVARGDERAKEILLAEAPEQLEQVLTTMGIDNQQKLEEVSRFASEFLAAPPDQQDAALINRINEIDGRGGDSSHTRSMLQMTPEERTAAARVAEVAALSAKDRIGRGTGAKLGAGVVVQRDDGTFEFASPILQDGQLGTQQTAITGTPVSRIGETAEARQARDIATAGGAEEVRQEAQIAATPERVSTEGVAKRRQENINKAVIAADAVPVIARAIDLLDSVETGGFDAAALLAKQQFGIESADEAELSNSMGKAVLSQLRDTFGAAFTAQEGESLKRIEANFGKSTVGNKRLLEQTKRLMDRVIDRGIKSAVDNEDFESAAQIKAAREFSLSIDADEQIPPLPAGFVLDESN